MTLLINLLDNGYQAIPCNGKRPTSSGWQADDLDFKKPPPSNWGGTNIGIRTGQGDIPIYAIDLDIYDESVCQSLVKSLKEAFGESPIRTGNAPKQMLFYRGKAGHKKLHRKWTDPSGKIHGVEILGHGQQFIAEGIHPDTQKQYSWDNPIGNLMAKDLTFVEHSDIQGWLNTLTVPENWVETSNNSLPNQAMNITTERWCIGAANDEEKQQIASALKSLDPSMPYDDWLKIGMALHNAYDGSDEGLMLFDKWSAKSDKYKSGEPSKKWHSFSNDPKDPKISFKTVFKMAIDNGWKNKPIDIHPKIIEHSERLAKVINEKINEEFDDTLEDQEYAHPEVIAAILASTFWSGQKSKGLMMDISGDNMIQFLEKDIPTQCQMIHGSFCDKEAIETRLNPSGQKLDAKDKRELRSILNIPSTYLTNLLKSRNHRDHMTISTDMFIEQSMMDIKRDVVAVRFKHTPFETRLPFVKIDPEIIDDYKEHFTRLDLFIDFIVQSRFASDRKYAYLWIKADSDWGKGFLMSAISNLDYNPGAVTALSVKEVEKMFEGGPVGKSLGDFKRSIVLHLDEFKTVKSELKQLENTIPVSPKNQLQFTAKTYAKIFTSAEGVPALIGDSGIEDQFANRFSLFEEEGMLSKRPMFIDRGKEAYMENVQSYTCHQLNSRIAEMKAMGRSTSADHGNRWLEGFIKDHGISNYAERLSESLPEVAEDFLDWIYTEDNSTSDLITTNLIFSKNKHSSYFNYYLKAPKSVWDKYIEISGQFSFSEQAAIKRKYEDIFKLISKDGSKRSETKHIPGKGKHKVIELKRKACLICRTRDDYSWAGCEHDHSDF